MAVRVPINKGKDIEPGTYDVRCIKVWPDVLENPQFGTGDVLKIKLQFPDIEEDDGSLFEMDAMANFTLSPRSKLYGWAMAFGCEIDLNADDFDAEEMLDKTAQAVIVKVKKPDGSTWPSIDSIVPAPVRRRRAAESAPKSEPKDDAAPSILTAMGAVDWTAFWTATTRMGMTRESVAAQWNGDLGTLEKADPIEVAEWMQITWEAAQASPV